MHHTPLVAGMGLPQGDGCSPLLMTLLLRLGFDEVSRVIGPRGFQCILMDDRTVVAETMQEVLNGKNVWKDFAECFHLVENDSKAQIVDLHSRAQIVDLRGHTDHSEASTYFEVLGCLMGKFHGKAVKQSKKLLSRFDKSLHMARRIAMLPTSVACRHADLQTFPVGAMAGSRKTRLLSGSHSLTPRCGRAWESLNMVCAV